MLSVMLYNEAKCRDTPHMSPPFDVWCEPFMPGGTRRMSENQKSSQRNDGPEYPLGPLE